MMRTMTRMAVAGCMALAALSAAAVLDVGSSTAEAAPSSSPFAGTYVWGSMPVTISDGGQISSPWENPDISGRVSADGGYSLTRSQTSYYENPRTGQVRLITTHLKSYGDMALDLDGNIVATSNRDTNGFVWIRQ